MPGEGAAVIFNVAVPFAHRMWAYARHVFLVHLEIYPRCGFWKEGPKWALYPPFVVYVRVAAKGYVLVEVEYGRLAFVEPCRFEKEWDAHLGA